MATDALTDLQLAVMTAVWRLGEATAAEVLEAMSADGRKLAPTTVATLLQRLAKQGWVKSRKNERRQLVFRAKVKQEVAAQGMLERLLGAFFGGKVSVLTAQLLESRDLSPAELRELRKLIDGKGC